MGVIFQNDQATIIMNDRLNNQWVRGSIYYDKTSWPRLLKDCIFPFIKKNKLIELHFVHLSFWPRDHIDLTLKTIDKDNKRLESQFLDFMDRFLLENPSTTTDLYYKFYPNNTAWNNQYYETDFYSFNTAGVSNLRVKISNALQVFGNVEIIDHSKFFSFIVYLQLGIFKAYYPIQSDAQTIVTDLLRLLGEANEKTKNPKLKYIITSDDILNENKSILTEMTEEIWSDLSKNKNLTWLFAWINECSNFSRKTNFQKKFTLISQVIYEHVGIRKISNLVMMHSFHETPLIKWEKAHSPKLKLSNQA